MRLARGPQCRMRSSREGQAIVTGIGGDRRRLAPCPCIERGRPKRAVAHGNIEEDHRRGKTGRYLRGSGKPYCAIAERGFPSPAPLTGGAGSLRPRPRRPTARRLDNGLQHRGRSP